jgi:Short C-terminal domain
MGAEIKTIPPSETGRRQSRGRAAAVWIVLVLAGLLLLLSTFAIWVNRVALNTDVFTSTSSSLLDDPQIRSAVANRAVDELFASVDVQAEVEDQLPSDYKGLSGAATAGLRQASYEIVDRALEQPRFQQLFKTTLKETHETLVQVLEGGGGRVSTQGGEVTLDLSAIIKEAADRIGIGQQVADQIPADAGRIVVLRANQLDTAQNAFQLLKALAWLLPILTILVFGLAVWLSGDRRRAVRSVGVVLVVVGILGLVAAKLTGNYVVDSLVAQVNTRPAANNAWDILTDVMRTSFRFMAYVGILFLLAAWFAGPGRRALAGRAWLAPVLRNRAWPYVALAIVGLFMLFNSSATDFTRVLIVLVLVALGATWIEVTRRQTLNEFPDATAPTLVTDARARMTDWWEERRAGSGREAAARASTDVATRLASLADLHARGDLSDDEYAAAKAQVLAGQ